MHGHSETAHKNLKFAMFLCPFALLIKAIISPHTVDATVFAYEHCGVYASNKCMLYIYKG